MTEDLGRLLAGRYRLSGLLGQGGMGAVWRALDEQLDREVAVKELRLPDHLPTVQREAWIARLDREARAAARLKHPAIITVHDRITSDDGRPWIVMELVRGPSLDELIRVRGPLPVQQVAAIGLQILAALRGAHQAGITHRDIKPANVLVEGDRVVLTDFGIAAVDGEAALTQSGALLGTPAFMSPEQVRGEPATPASDLWSLGATLYTAVQGHPPFGGGSPGAVFVAIATEEPVLAGHAGSLGPVLAGLLRKSPPERPTIDQVQALLAPLTLNGLPDQGTQGGQTGPGTPARNHRGATWPGPVVAGAAILLGVSVLLPWVGVTVHTAAVPSAVSQQLNRSVNGLGQGVSWGWLTMVCAVAAGALGVIGGVKRRPRLVSAAAIPGMIALLSPVLVVFRLDSAKRSTSGLAARLPPVVYADISGHTQVSLQVGWFLSLVIALTVIGVSGAAFATAVKRR